MDLVKLVYEMSSRLPPEEKYGLTSQIRRSAVSIPSNIAEGQGRGTKAEASRYAQIARGSLAELETQLLLISHIYEEPDVQPAMRMIIRVRQMLTRLYDSLREEAGGYDQEIGYRVSGIES